VDDLQRLHVASQRTRQKILELLSKNDKINNAGHFATELKIKYKICVFHLKTLEKAGLVEGKFALNEDIATKCYAITQKGKDIFPRVAGLK
jgi:predicted ArsR family transcriptional regulator